MNRSLRSLQSTTTLGGQILLLGVAFIGAGLLAPNIAVAQQYWDGQDTTGTPGVSGGNGIWDGTSTNWTDETGTSNAAWTLGGIAIFSGNPGSVTVNSPQNITGLLFKTNGYLLQGESLNLVGTENTFSVESGMSASIGSVISGSGGLIKAADGTLILTGTNTYTGGTKIADGTLSVSDDENLGAADGALTLDGGTIKVTGTDFVALGTNRNFTMTGNGGGINIDNVSNSFVMSQILGGSGDFRKEGAGALVLTGDSSGFAGATEIQSGKLLVDNKLGGNIDVQAQGLLGGNGTIGGDVNVADGGTIAPGGNVGSLSIGGDLTLSSGSSSGFQLGALGKNDFIAVGKNLTLDGTLNLSNAGGANGNAGIGYYRIMSYGGDLTDNGVVLGTTPSGLSGADISVDVEQSGYIDLVVSDGSERYWKGDDSQGGSGTWNGSTDWLKADGTSASFTGGTAIFRNLGNAPASLVTINGSRSAESLQFVTNGYSLVSGTNGALVSSNLFRPMELRALQGVSATIDVPIVSGALGLCGGIEKTGGGSVALGGDNSHCGTTISDGTLSVSSDENLGSANGSLTLNGGVLQVTGTGLTGLSNNRDLTMTGNGGGIDVAAAGNIFTVSQALNGTGAFSKEGAGTLALTGNNTYTGGTTISGGILQLGNGGNSGTVAGDIANNGQLAFNRSNTLTFGGAISGSGSVSQIGTGTTTLTGTNTYTGGTTIRDGKLSVSADANLGGTNGSLRLDGGVLQVTGTNYAELAASRSLTMTSEGGGIDVATAGNIFTVSQALNGTGAFSKQGAGTLALTGNNSYSGGTTISGGTLQLGNGGTSGAVTGNIANNGQLAFNRSNALTFGGVISGNGGVSQIGTGTTVLTGTNTYTGGTTISSGILQLGNGGTLGALNGSTTVNGGLLQMGGTNQTQANLSLTGGGVSLVNDKTGDRFNLTSNYQGGQSGQILLDIDLAAESADVITIGGVAMGKMNLRLNNISEVTEPILGSSILLVDIQGSGNNLDVTADGLPTGGVVRYDLVRQPASGGNGYQYVVKSGVDGNAASAVVSGFIAAQNVVASSFFKPSSGLVSAPIDPDKNQFGIAPWMRTNSGMSTIETSGTIRQPDGTLIDTPAKLDSQYIGYQFGFDGGLFNINDTDANINVGVTAGQIFGSSDQKNYENTTDFQSVFYGAYAAFTKGPLFLDLQVRQELTDYTVNVNDEVFQIGGEKVSGTRNSIGGSASYTYARNDWSLIPAVGFTYSMNQTDDLSIPRNILLNQKEGKVRFEDVESMISFGGLTVSKNYFVLDDRLRLSPFITLTAYHDFAGDIDATMTIDQNSANPIVLPVTTKRLQTYGEASIGMNLLSLTGKIGGAERLMVGSVRGDFQFGEDVVGGAVTAQFRMQF